jgi:hypothetical protein
LLRSPLDRARKVLTYRAMCSVAGPCDPVVWVFSTSGFHRFLATKPVRSETNKAEQWSNLATIVLSGTRGPSLFLVIREGLGSRERLGARGTQRLTNQLRLALEPECLENPTATAREDPQDGADWVRDTQTVCGFRCWASKHTPVFHTINTMVAIFLAKVRRAISARMPLVNKAV